MKKKENKKVFVEKALETPKVSFVLGGVGFLIILYSFLTLENPFFLVTGVFAGIVFFYWAYDYWYKKLNDLALTNLSHKVDFLMYPPK